MAVEWVTCHGCKNLAPKSSSGYPSMCDSCCKEWEDKQFDLAIAASLEPEESASAPAAAPAWTAPDPTETTWTGPAASAPVTGVVSNDDKAVHINRLFDALKKCPRELPLYPVIEEAIKVALNIS